MGWPGGEQIIYNFLTTEGKHTLNQSYSIRTFQDQARGSSDPANFKNLHTRKTESLRGSW